MECPVDECGRKFNDPSKYKNHIERNHPHLLKFLEEDNDYIDAIGEDLDEMLRMSDSLILESQRDLQQENSISQTYTQCLMKEDIDKNKDQFLKIYKKNDKILDLETVLNHSEFDDEFKDNKDAKQKIELVETLSLSNLQLTNVSGDGNFNPQQLKSLRILNLSNNRLGDIEGFDSCVNLEEIHISNNYISELKGFSYCLKLKKITANNNNFTDLLSFQSIDSLKVLELGDNRICNLEEALIILSELPKLKELVLKGNPVTQAC